MKSTASLILVTDVLYFKS